MSYISEYNKKLVSAGEAAKVVQSGDWVEYGAFTAQPSDLDRALAGRREELVDVKIRATARVIPAPPAIVMADQTKEKFTYNSGHFSIVDRKLHDYGLCYYVPILYREVPDYYCLYRTDVVMITVTTMDEHGYFNFGLHNSHTMAAIENAKTIIVEVNKNYPRVLGGKEECVHISQVDYIVESVENQPPTPLPEIHASEVDLIIAEMILNEIEDGSCIQLGIGAMPNTLGKLIAQSDLKDLGGHSEMLCEAYLHMYEAGKMNGKRKNIDKGKIVFTFALGSPRLYEFLHNNPAVASHPVNYTNNPGIISQNDRVISINNAVEVDLFGQVCSESSGTRQISGTGGQVDFIEGAYYSKGGKSFICLSSTYTDKNGDTQSRIKPLLTPGAIVTATRSTVMYVVTEYGMVNLKGKSTWERAEALISLAHPDFREELIKEAEKMKIWRRCNKRCG